MRGAPARRNFCELRQCCTTTGTLTSAGTFERPTEELMDDDRTINDPAPGAVPPQAHTPATPARKRRRWPLMLFGLVVVVPLLGISAWTAVALNWSYSKGDRGGFIQKFSQKGWICKTWEGEIAMVNLPGAAQERFLFSVRSDSVAREITRLIGSRVDLTYEEHRGVPGSCFGDTPYFVTGVRAIGGP